MTRTSVNWGLIGPGKIAEKFARDISLVPNAALVSVPSSDPKRARSFAERCKVPRAAESYFQILNDPEIAAVHIATIHPNHYNIAKDASIAGKPVLIEKPMTINAAQAKALVSLSRTSSASAKSHLPLREITTLRANFELLLLSRAETFWVLV